MYHFYVYVPPCRRCGSYRTGYFTVQKVQNSKADKRSIKRGEYTIPVPFLLRDEPNCFCMDCGISWYEKLKVSLYSSSKIAEQKVLRGINDSQEAGRSIDMYFNEHRRNDEENKKPSFVKRGAKKLFMAIKW